MAEENQEKKSFYPFTIKRDESSARQKKIDELKRKFSLADILKVLDEDGDDDVDVILAKITAKKMQEALVRELNAMDAAQAANSNKKKAYQEHKDKKGNDVGGKVELFAEYYEKQDEYIEKHAAKYNSYYNLRLDIEQNAKNEQDRADQLKALEKDPQFRDAIAAHDALEKLEENAENLRAGFDAMERLPEETQRNLLQFYQECHSAGKDEEFNQAFAELMSDDRFFPQKDANDPDKIANRHEFDLYKDKDDKEHIRHSIYNLGSSGLDICMVDNKLGFTHCPAYLTEEQAKALAEYCYYNGIGIEDYHKLNELKIVDKDGKETETAPQALERYFSNLSNDGLSEERTGGVQAEVPTEGGFGKYLPSLPELDVKRSTMVEACKKRIGLMGFPPESGLISTSRGWNSTIISVYASENDMLMDGEVDKNGKRQHTKAFAIELKHTTPPRARLYIEPGKKFEADHARLALDAFKATGCKYFMIPSADKMGGKPVQGAFIKASVKTGMVPYLKRSKDGKGSFVGAPDLETVLEELPKEPGLTPKEKVEYQMRWSEELKRYMSWNKKAGEQLGTLASKIEYGAKFGMFTISYLDNLQQHIEKGMNGELEGRQWDSVDQVTATAAMNKIIKDLQRGQLDGKPYNPLADNDQALKNALEHYMAKERPEVEKEIDENLKKLALSGDKEDAKTKQAVSTALRARKEALDRTCEELKGYGIEIRPRIVSAKADYVKSSSRSHSRDDEDEKNKRRQSFTERYGGSVERK